MKRVAVVTGGSCGIGLALVQGLASDHDLVIAASRAPEASEELDRAMRQSGGRIRGVAVDLADEPSIAAMASAIAEMAPHVDTIVNAAGVLHDSDVQPEKKLEQVDAASLARVFALNAFAPLLVAKHLAPLFLPPHGEKTRRVIANVSAKVGSIGDNRLGGWYAYRASKAAQNMTTRTLAIELARRAPSVIVLALHPGTVATRLSEPFRKGAPRVLSPAESAAHLLEIVRAATPEQSGRFFAWDGAELPW
ncbi:MAG: SDR family oxidoreductase [Myxococcota bacterium]|jgi:NAD(P)-dependent dehydrogenase (short-subunit alcohol dehydrogenase family)|nr:SDR family oxidoreductase [Myxococcota bacterium]